MPTAANMLRSAHVVPDLFETLPNNGPRAAIVMPLEVADILENDVPRLAALDDSDDLVEQSAPCFVFQSLLVTGLRKRLAGKTRAEDLVLRHLVGA